MQSTYFLKVFNPDIALILEHEGHSIGNDASSDNSHQAKFPLVGVRILLPDGIVEGRPLETWAAAPVTVNPVLLASL